MKQKYIIQILILCISVFAVIGTCYGCDVLFSALHVPAFSVESGFYQDPFYLEITTNRDADIYYTLDGSEPTEDSIHYEGPIYLEDASSQPNRISARTDVSAAFIDEPDRYVVPEEPIDKANVVRAIAISKDKKETSPIATATYLVGDRVAQYYGTEVLSLVTDPFNLLDYETGIYVNGKTLDDYIAALGPEGLEEAGNWRWWNANYNNPGREWERQVHYERIDSEGLCFSSEEAGLRICGGSSRAFLPKGFRLYARKEYSGRETFMNPFVGGYARSRVKLFTGAQDYRTKMYDALVGYAVQDLNFEVMDRRPCNIFLNGEYWGFYWEMEDVCDEYVVEHYSVPKDDVVVIKNEELKTFGEKSEVCLAEWNEILTDTAPVDDARYQYLCDRIDMQSFIDYYATEMYIEHVDNDWPGKNEALWRSTEKLAAEKCDTRWRWLLFDTNGGCFSKWDDDTIAYTMKRSNLFAGLMAYDPFKQAFLDKLEHLANYEFDPVRLAPEYECLCNLLREPARRDLKLHYGDKKGPEEFEKEVEHIADFLQKRKDYIIELVKAYR